MQTKNDNLYALIHSLSAPEKRYFKSFVQGASNQQDAKYLRLFDLIARQKVYNEQALLKDPVFEQNANRLAVAKNYLFQLILKSLRNTATNRNSEMHILELLLDIESLYQRRMFAAASKIAEKARKIAEDCLYFDLLIIICAWERRLTDQIDDGSKYSTIYESILVRENDTAHQLRMNSIYYGQYKKLYFSNLKEGFLKKGKSLSDFLRYLKIPALEDYKLATNPVAKLLYHFCYIEYYYAMREHHNRYQLNKQVMNLFVEHPGLKIRSPKYYIKGLVLFLKTQLHLKKTEAFDQNIRLLENYKIPDYAHDLHRMRESQLLILILYRRTMLGSYEGAINEIVPRIEAYFKGYRHQMIHREELALKLEVVWMYLGVRDYEKALQWLTPLEMQIDPEYFSDNYMTFCILNMMIHYEYKDEKAVRDYADDLFDFLKAKKKVSSTAAFLIRFFRLASEDLYDREKQKELLTQLKEQHITLRRYISTLPSYFLDCIVWWLDSILQNKSVSNLVRTYSPVPVKRSIPLDQEEESHGYPSLFEENGVQLLERTNLME